MANPYNRFTQMREWALWQESQSGNTAAALILQQITANQQISEDLNIETETINNGGDVMNSLAGSILGGALQGLGQGLTNGTKDTTNNENKPPEEETFWTKNKGWIIPTGIGTVLTVVVIVAVKSKKGGR